MPIRVTCPGCHTRFNVNEKFAGKKGPCPKCKRTIEIPAEEVKIHAPESFGPKDATGQGVLKPIFRKEATVSPVQITLIIGSIVLFFAAALIVRLMVADKEQFSSWILVIVAAILALPLAYAGYTFLRDSELAPLSGQELWTRLAICSAIYVVLWAAMPISFFTFGSEWGVMTWAAAFVAMIGLGGAAAMGALNLDFIMGALHYGLYLVACVLGRWIAGVGVVPGALEIDAGTTPAGSNPTDTTAVIQSAFDALAVLLG